MYKTSNIPRDACMPSLPPLGVPYTPALVVLLAVVVLVLEEEMLVSAVGNEGDGRDTEAGEAVLEAVPAGVAALVSPSFVALPGVVSRLTGGFLEGPHVEAGDVGLGPARGGS